MAEEAIRVTPSIKISILELINKTDENANEKIWHINNAMKPACVLRGWSFIDNACIKIKHLKSKGIHLNGEGVKILASDIMRQALKAKFKAGKHKQNQGPLWMLAQALIKTTQASSGT